MSARRVSPEQAKATRDRKVKRRSEVVTHRYRTDPAFAATLRAKAKRNRERLRLEALQAYSTTTPFCACCGEANLAFLTLDHVDGTGGVERRTQGHRGGTATYRYVRQHGYPPGYRVLCWNCNCAIGLYGRCPHESEYLPLIAKDDIRRVTR